MDTEEKKTTSQEEEKKPPEKTPATGEGTPNIDELAEKVTEILNKRQNGLAKSILRSDGADDETIAAVIKKLTDGKQNKELDTLREEVKQLHGQLKEADFTASFKQAAEKLNINPGRLDAVKKLSDFSNIYNDNGKVNSDKLEEALKAVLDKVPEFKAEPKAKYFKVGAGKKEEPADDYKEKMRKVMGLNNK